MTAQNPTPEQQRQDMRIEQLDAEQSCDHGAMVRRAGVSWHGKPWAGWFCKAGDKSCAPEWANLAEIILPALNAWAAESRS